MIVTIDGPAGAGKSSLARQTAEKLGFEFLDTGALYRAIALGALRQGIALHDAELLIAHAKRSELRWQDERIYLDGDDVTDDIRTPEVTAAIRFVADLPAVRQRLSELQRQIAADRNVVTEGRDQGSEVFPHAACKIFLTASSEERALRRQRQLEENGVSLALQEILDAQNRRDAEDQSRPVGRLRPAPDATIINTDGMTPDDVLQEILRIVDDVMQETDAR